jgi:PPM family protein phosphatase
MRVYIFSLEYVANGIYMTEKLLSIHYAGGSDRGKVRELNEDSILMSEFEHSEVVLLQVADGVGGYAGGEVASKFTVEVIQSSVEKSVLQAHSGGGYGIEWLEKTLLHAIAEANEKLREQQKLHEDLSQMATTIVAILIHKNQIAISHLGDSRCYQFVQQKLTQLTEDHTALQKLLNEGKINQHEFEILPMHHVISQAVGLIDEPEITTRCFTFEPLTSYLLCSDGLTNCISDAQIQHILEKHTLLADAVDELITCANDNGGVDNISVVLVEREGE